MLGLIRGKIKSDNGLQMFTILCVVRPDLCVCVRVCACARARVRACVCVEGVCVPGGTKGPADALCTADSVPRHAGSLGPAPLETRV